MTQLVKNQITIAIKEEFCSLQVPEDQLQAVTMRIAKIVDEALADACMPKSREECSWEKLPCIKVYDVVYDVDQEGTHLRLARNYHMTPDLSLSAIKTSYRRTLVRKVDVNRERGRAADCCYSTFFATDVKVLDVPDEENLKLIQYTLHSLTLTPYKDEHGEIRLKGRWTSYPVKRFASSSVVTSEASLRSALPTCTIAQ